MAQSLRATTLAVSIACSPQRVYEFVAAPENLPRWAPAFCLSIRRVGNDWLVNTPIGTVKFRFVTPNDLGVLDHVVTLDNEVILNPMRVLANGSGSELLFTLFQRPGMTDAQFAEDTTLVERDLNTLKALMEAAP
ncbi:MAG: SRPBCC family protein [Gallionella sp.]